MSDSTHPNADTLTLRRELDEMETRVAEYDTLTHHLRRTGLIFGVAETQHENGMLEPLYILLKMEHADRRADIIFLAETIPMLCTYLESIPEDRA